MAKITLPTGSISVVPNAVQVVKPWIEQIQADALFASLLQELSAHLQPHRGFRGFLDKNRLTARLGDHGITYVYGDRSHKLGLFTPTLLTLRDKLVTDLGVPFNCCYVNLYVNGEGSLARHSDTPKLPQLGPELNIVAISFGAPRTLQFWASSAPRDRSQMLQVDLGHGDLCLMYDRSQADWLHGVPKQKGVVGQRMSITYRFHNP